MSRLDIELVNRKLFATRSKAQNAIKEKLVFCDGILASKAGLEVNENTNIEIKGEVLKYVSRGGLKLEKALKEWNIDLTSKIMLDIGSSTGGFSNVAILNNIGKIYAIDVGKEQFDKELAKDSRIHLYEETDFRTISNDIIKDANFATFDVSFISVIKLLPKLSELSNVKEVVCLIKPQFECGMEIASKFKGVIKDENVRKQTIENVVDGFKNIEFKNVGITESPIRGGDGNIEYLGYFVKIIN